MDCNFLLFAKHEILGVNGTHGSADRCQPLAFNLIGFNRLQILQLLIFQVTSIFECLSSERLNVGTGFSGINTLIYIAMCVVIF